jgi:DNA invertase Pin-like site-specific DNA recombinase
MTKTKRFGYVRVSSRDQNIDRQVNELIDIGISERDIFVDKTSGKDFNRESFQLLKKILREGDILYVKSIDRFGRNSKDIKAEWEEITQKTKADIVVLDMPILDTTQYKDTLGSFVSDLVLQVLAFVAEKERNDIRKRQAEGIAVAKAKGKTLGRPRIDYTSISTEQKNLVKENYPKWKNNEITAVRFMDLLNLKRNTFYKIIKEYEEQITKD